MAQLISPETFIRLLAQVGECDPGSVELDTPLDAVVRDSFAALELFVAIEDATGVTVEWEPDLVATVGDLYRLYVGLAAERSVVDDA